MKARASIKFVINKINKSKKKDLHFMFVLKWNMLRLVENILNQMNHSLLSSPPTHCPASRAEHRVPGTRKGEVENGPRTITLSSCVASVDCLFFPSVVEAIVTAIKWSSRGKHAGTDFLNIGIKISD